MGKFVAEKKLGRFFFIQEFKVVVQISNHKLHYSNRNSGI